MKINRDSLTVVLAGAFNPAILSPQWLARHILRLPEAQEFRVEVLAPLAGGIGGMPRYSFERLSYAPSFQNLTLFVDNLTSDSGERACTIAAQILAELPHTPVSGVGLNFGFSVNAPSANILDLIRTSTPMIDAFPGGCEVVARSWSNKVTWNRALVTTSVRSAGELLEISLNFHHEVSSATDAAAVLSPAGAYNDFREAAISVAQALSQENLETE